MPQVCGFTNGLGWIIHVQHHHKNREREPIPNAHSAGGVNLLSLSHTHTRALQCIARKPKHSDKPSSLHLNYLCLNCCCGACCPIQMEWFYPRVGLSRYHCVFLSNTLAILGSKCFLVSIKASSASFYVPIWPRGLLPWPQDLASGFCCCPYRSQSRRGLI